jgi:hypothetical protein
VSTTTADDVAVAGTDYRYQTLADGHIASATLQRDSSVRMGIDAQGALAASFTRMGMEGERFGATMSVATGTMVGNMINNMQAIGSDDAIALVKMGMNLSNSNGASVPATQALGPGSGGGNGGGLQLNLPKGSTVTM